MKKQRENRNRVSVYFVRLANRERGEKKESVDKKAAKKQIERKILCPRRVSRKLKQENF